MVATKSQPELINTSYNKKKNNASRDLCNNPLKENILDQNITDSRTDVDDGMRTDYVSDATKEEINEANNIRISNSSRRREDRLEEKDEKYFFEIFGRTPMVITCPHCGVEEETDVRNRSNFVTCATSVGILVTFWPLFFVPFLVPQVSLLKINSLLVQYF